MPPSIGECFRQVTRKSRLVNPPLNLASFDFSTPGWRGTTIGGRKVIGETHEQPDGSPHDPRLKHQAKKLHAELTRLALAQPTLSQIQEALAKSLGFRNFDEALHQLSATTGAAPSSNPVLLDLSAAWKKDYPFLAQEPWVTALAQGPQACWEAWQDLPRYDRPHWGDWVGWMRKVQQQSPEAAQAYAELFLRTWRSESHPPLDRYMPVLLTAMVYHAPLAQWEVRLSNTSHRPYGRQWFKERCHAFKRYWPPANSMLKIAPWPAPLLPIAWTWSRSCIPRPAKWSGCFPWPRTPAPRPLSNTCWKKYPVPPAQLLHPCLTTLCRVGEGYRHCRQAFYSKGLHPVDVLSHIIEGPYRDNLEKWAADLMPPEEVAGWGLPDLERALETLAKGSALAQPLFARVQAEKLRRGVREAITPARPTLRL